MNDSCICVYSTPHSPVRRRVVAQKVLASPMPTGSGYSHTKPQTQTHTQPSDLPTAHSEVSVMRLLQCSVA
jgi:hypothetical protein